MRTRLGFDFNYHILDVILTPDLTSWDWEDEDELEEAVDNGLVTREFANSLYARGRAVIEELQSGESIFNRWEKWRPDPNWAIPVLPEGWDIL